MHKSKIQNLLKTINIPSWHLLDVILRYISCFHTKIYTNPNFRCKKYTL